MNTQCEQTRPASEDSLSFPGKKIPAVKELAASKLLIPVNIKLLQLNRTCPRAESGQSLKATEYQSVS